MRQGNSESRYDQISKQTLLEQASIRLTTHAIDAFIVKNYPLKVHASSYVHVYMLCVTYMYVYIYRYMHAIPVQYRLRKTSQNKTHRPDREIVLYMNMHVSVATVRSDLSASQEGES